MDITTHRFRPIPCMRMQAALEFLLGKRKPSRAACLQHDRVPAAAHIAFCDHLTLCAPVARRYTALARSSHELSCQARLLSSHGSLHLTYRA